mmetsp:Transcript_901/g.1597  ORF Transcript_901/g.1597 Transcript_901/m.1597 type:complete len:167 (+) Transcript_901:670-1170(+)
MNLPFLSLEQATAALGQKTVVRFAKSCEAPVAKKIQAFEDGVRVTTAKCCRSCHYCKKHEEFTNEEWTKAVGTGECKHCQKTRRRVPDSMDAFEVVVPDGVKANETFHTSANGQRVTLTCPPTAQGGIKVRFHLPKGASSSTTEVKLRRCRTCDITKPKEGFGSNQ